MTYNDAESVLRKLEDLGLEPRLTSHQPAEEDGDQTYSVAVLLESATDEQGQQVSETAPADATVKHHERDGRTAYHIS